MKDALIGKRAVVTGAASGIGRAIAKRFHEEGAAVALLDRQEGAYGEFKRTWGRGENELARG